MFGSSNKSKPGATNFNEILSNPLLQMALKRFNVNLDTIIPEAAQKAAQTIIETGLPIFLMMAVNDDASGFDIGFYTSNESGMILLHSVTVRNIPEAIAQFSNISETFKNIATNEQFAQSNKELSTDGNPTAIATPGAVPLDQPDGE